MLQRRAVGPVDSGLFDFWLRFGSVTGFFKPAPSPKPRPKSKILAAHRHIISVNALVIPFFIGAVLSHNTRGKKLTVMFSEEAVEGQRDWIAFLEKNGRK